MDETDGITGAAAAFAARVGDALPVVCEVAAVAGACAAHKIEANKNTATTKAVLVKRIEYVYLCSFAKTAGYSIFGIAVDRKHALKWLFPQRGPQRQVSVAGVEVKSPFCTTLNKSLSLSTNARPVFPFAFHRQTVLRF